MDYRANFWKRYLPIEKKIKDNIFYTEVSFTFNNLFFAIFANRKTLNNLPIRLKFEVLDIAKQHENYSEFMKDVYLTHKATLDEIRRSTGQQPFSSWYDFETNNAGDFMYHSTDAPLNEMERILADK